MGMVKTFTFNDKELDRIDDTVNSWASERNFSILSTSMVKTYESGLYFEILVSVVYGK